MAFAEIVIQNRTDGSETMCLIYRLLKSNLKNMLKAVLPVKNFSVKDMIDLVAWIQLKNHKAYLSQRKKKLGKNNEEELAA